MDYKEKYEQALERCKEEFNFNNLAYSHEEIKQKLQRVFPELKESEDERIRKELIECVKGIYKGCCTEETRKERNMYLAWLEKQDHDGKMWIYRDVYLKEKEQLVQDGIDEVLQHPQKYGLEKQGKQKSADKVEPKFKVGDWIVHCNEDIDLITGIEETGYIINEGSGYIPFVCEDDMRLWTIEDAKDGDVLASENGCPFIYKNTDGIEAHFYCCVSITNSLCVDDGTNHCGYKESSKPATKEQRDLLFQKMKEAGYEWDAEKKELKKIEQKPDMIQWKGNNLKEIIDFTGKDKNFDKWFKSFAEYEKYVSEHDNIFKLFNADGSHFEIPVGSWIVKTPDGYNVASKAIFKNKPAEWSEEDEKISNTIYESIDFLCLKSFGVSEDEVYDWLKSLKERMKK